MTFLGLLDRRVTIIPMVAGAKDRYNHTTTVAGTPVTDVAARRDQADISEDVIDRDQQRTVFRYFFEAGVAITGRDRIIDGGDTLEVLGEPDEVSGYHGTHHVEVRAYKVEG